MHTKGDNGMATIDQEQRSQTWVSHGLQAIIIIVSLMSFLWWREHVTTAKIDSRFEKIDARLDNLSERVARIEGMLLREKGVALKD